jgi:hypothetical protein
LGSLQSTRTKRTQVKVKAFNKFNFHKPFGLNKPKKQQLMKYFYLIQVRSGFSFSLKAGKEIGVISNLLTEKKRTHGRLDIVVGITHLSKVILKLAWSEDATFL